MGHSIIYLLEVNLGIALAYLLYCVLFRNDTLIHFRRIYFVSSVIFSFIYPLLQLGLWFNSSIPMLHQVSGTTLNIAHLASTQAGAMDYQKLILLILITISALLFLRMLIRVISIYLLARKAKEVKPVHIICLEDEIKPFSFFRWTFINESLHTPEERNEILLHEQVHIKELHSWDVMLGELMCVVCWFNPFAWLLRKELVINLEYLADQGVLELGLNKKAYQYHLVQLSNHKTFSIATNFNVSQLKKRIIMMNMVKSPRKTMLKYLMIVPFYLLLLGINQACTPDAPRSSAEIMPQFSGGMNAMMNYLGKELKYPPEEVGKGIEGSVLVKFVVENDGEVSEVSVVKSLDAPFDQEAMRVVKTMPKWTPGKQDGKSVAVYYTIPILFKQ